MIKHSCFLAALFVSCRPQTTAASLCCAQGNRCLEPPEFFLNPLAIAFVDEVGFSLSLLIYPKAGRQNLVYRLDDSSCPRPLLRLIIPLDLPPSLHLVFEPA